MKFVGPWTVHNHCLRQKSQHLRLLFIEQYINSNRVSPKRVKKKKSKTQNADESKRRRVSKLAHKLYNEWLGLRFVERTHAPRPTLLQFFFFAKNLLILLFSSFLLLFITFIVLFSTIHNFTILFQLIFIFIYNTFSKKNLKKLDI